MRKTDLDAQTESSDEDTSASDHLPQDITPSETSDDETGSAVAEERLLHLGSLQIDTLSESHSIRTPSPSPRCGQSCMGSWGSPSVRLSPLSSPSACASQPHAKSFEGVGVARTPSPSPRYNFTRETRWPHQGSLVLSTLPMAFPTAEPSSARPAAGGRPVLELCQVLGLPQSPSPSAQALGSGHGEGPSSPPPLPPVLPQCVRTQLNRKDFSCGPPPSCA